MDQNKKFCFQCKHLSMADINMHKQCTRPELVDRYGVDLVTGASKPIAAIVMRDVESACGRDGKYWTARAQSDK